MFPERDEKREAREQENKNLKRIFKNTTQLQTASNSHLLVVPYIQLLSFEVN